MQGASGFVKHAAAEWPLRGRKRRKSRRKNFMAVVTVYKAIGVFGVYLFDGQLSDDSRYDEQGQPYCVEDEHQRKQLTRLGRG